MSSPKCPIFWDHIPCIPLFEGTRRVLVLEFKMNLGDRKFCTAPQQEPCHGESFLWRTARPILLSPNVGTPYPELN